MKKAHTLILAICLFSLVGCTNEETGIISEFGESSIKLNQASGAVRAIEHIHNIANYTPDLQKFKNENQRVKIIFEWGDPELAGLRENVKVIRRIEPLSKE